MKTDKNTIIGFVLLAVLFFVYFWYTSKEQNAYFAEKKRIEDSVAKVNAAKRVVVNPEQARLDSLRRDSLSRLEVAGGFTTAALGKEEIQEVENELMVVRFTNKGGMVKSVQLKNYMSADDKPVELSSGADEVLGYSINTAPNRSAGTSSLFFASATTVKNADGSQVVRYTLHGEGGQTVLHQFTIYPDNYKIDWELAITGAGTLLTAQTVNLLWKAQPKAHERYADYERQMTNIVFSENNEFDYISQKTEKVFEQPAQWVGIAQQFFNTTLVSNSGFTSGKISWARVQDSTNVLANVNTQLQIKLPATESVNSSFQFYFGPNDYAILKKQAPEMERIVNLGRDAYAFVRPINKYIIQPVFDFFASFVTSYGWVIALLTLFIRLVTSPLTYSSYLSGAKMKALRPELDALKQKMGDDQQGFAMEQMKMFREAGVNPLGGCIPALLQIPIFFALYSFFNSAIALRGEGFWWAKDLSQYDSIFELPFSIPAYGDHVSLFTLTAVITSFLISIYNMAMTPTNDNPALKYMPYIFPFILLFIFNRLPAALTWYYTVSNLMTLGLQFVIQHYIIDHDKILAKIEANRKKPKKQNKWQEKYQQMVESQKKLQEMKEKTQKKK
jgi:YidC/Oxa1 family membrane protein insertase